jgi:hypothetical protein
MIEVEGLEEAIEVLKKIARIKDRMVKDWQAGLKSGDFFVQNFYGFGSRLSIYGEILGIEKRSRNLRRVRAFSALCPEGEIGTLHVADATKKISKEDFLLAERLGWPDIEEFERVLSSIGGRGC